MRNEPRERLPLNDPNNLADKAAGPMRNVPDEDRMKFVKAHLQIMLLTCVLLPSARSSAEDLSAEEIMTKVDYATRKAFTTQLADVKITTCKYRVVKGRVQCAEQPRVVVAQNAKKVKVVDGLYSDKSLSIVREPVSDKGMSLLVYEYSEKGRDNDNWLYLPALGKVTRVIANTDEGGSVFGSEFSVETTENPEARKLYEYTYEILEETTLRGRPAWVIELLPTPEKAKKTRYDKVVAWIDKQTFLTLKEDLYRNGRIHKQRTQSELERIDGIFVATKVVMNNLTTSRISQMDKMAMRHNTEILDEFLSQRALTDFAFRERNLARFRAELSE